MSTTFYFIFEHVETFTNPLQTVGNPDGVSDCLQGYQNGCRHISAEHATRPIFPQRATKHRYTHELPPSPAQRLQSLLHGKLAASVRSLLKPTWHESERSLRALRSTIHIGLNTDPCRQSETPTDCRQGSSHIDIAGDRGDFRKNTTRNDTKWAKEAS